MKDHPVLRGDVQRDVVDTTMKTLQAQGGTGRVVVEFDFKDWRAVSYRLVTEGARKALTRPGG